MILFAGVDKKRQLFILLFSFILVYLFYGVLSVCGIFMVDDSFFYAQIAYNIGINHISSFDGLHITNGYHPLWCWLLSIVSFVASVFTKNKEIHLFLYIWFYMFISVNISIIFFRNNLERLIAFSILLFSTILMETTLLSLLLLAFFYIFFVGEKENSRIGELVLFLVPLTRIDGIIFALPIGILLFSFNL